MYRLFGFICFSFILFSCTREPIEPSPTLEEIFAEPEVEDYSHLMSDFEIETLAAINAFRAEQNDCGGEIMVPVPELAWHPNIDAAAEGHARDMFMHDLLTHDGSDGSTLGDRLERAEYFASYWGENVAKGPRTPAEAVEAFANSPGHCKVMASPNFKQVGIAKVGEYWVFDFGTLR